MSTISSSTARTQATAADWRSSVARIGLVGKALLYGMFGLLAIDVATGGNGSSSTAGAIERIMGDGPARYLLIGSGQAAHVLAVYLALFEQEDLPDTPMNEWLWTPLHAPLRQLPGFSDYLQLAGLIDYWDATAWPDWCRREAAGEVVCQ